MGFEIIRGCISRGRHPIRSHEVSVPLIKCHPRRIAIHLSSFCSFSHEEREVKVKQIGAVCFGPLRKAAKLGGE